MTSYQPGTVLVASPVYPASERFFSKFLNAWEQLCYPQATFCLVANGFNTEDMPVWLQRVNFIRHPGDLCVERVDTSGEPPKGWGALTKAQNRIRAILLQGTSEFLLLNETSRPLA